jgi:hypothetical protein
MPRFSGMNSVNKPGVHGIPETSSLLGLPLCGVHYSDQRRARASKERHGFIDPTCVAATFDNRFPNVSSQLPSSQLPSEGFLLKAGGFCFKLTPREVHLFFIFFIFIVARRLICRCPARRGSHQPYS